MTCPVLANSADPDQLASEEANWSGSALFVIKDVNFYQKSRIKLSDWLEIRSGRGILIYSARQGLRQEHNRVTTGVNLPLKPQLY